MSKQNEKLTTGRVLAKNSLLNIVGTFIPLFLAVVAIPILIRSIGTDRFGILTLVWVIVGYFGLFDLGLGSSITKLVSEKLDIQGRNEIPAIVWTAQALMILLGLTGALLLAVLSPWLVHDILLIPKPLEAEVQASFFLIALSIPFVVCAAGWRGLLMAYQRFDYINIIRASFGAFTFVGPLAVLPFSKSLVPIVALLIIGRGVVFLSYLTLCLKANPALRMGLQVKLALAKHLLSFGSWMTVSNVLRPLMVYMDRFFIGALISTAAVAYYTTPYEIITKLTLIPVAVSSVFFPAFSRMLADKDGHVEIIFGRGTKYIFLVIFPLVLVSVTFANEILTLWLDKKFAVNSTFVLKVLSVGILINCIAHLPSALIQGAGRPDITAKLNIIELPIYLLMLWFLLAHYGILGVAVAWSVRVALDTFLLYMITEKMFPATRHATRRITVSLFLALITLFCAFFLSGIILKVLFVLLTLSLFFLVSWKFLLSMDDRKELHRIVLSVMNRAV